MGYGPHAWFGLNVQEDQEPGQPTGAVRQVSATEGEFDVFAPLNDADGNPLTGLTAYQAVVLNMSPESAEEQYGTNFDAALVANGAQVFSGPLAAGGSATQKFVITLDGDTAYAVGMRCTDDVQSPPVATARK